jgi:hypothetical protein
MRKALVLALAISIPVIFNSCNFIYVLFYGRMYTSYEYYFVERSAYSGLIKEDFKIILIKIEDKYLYLHLDIYPKNMDDAPRTYKEYYNLYISFDSNKIPIKRITINNISIEYNNIEKNLINDIKTISFVNGYYSHGELYTEDEILQLKKDGILEFPSNNEYNTRRIGIHNLPVNFDDVKEFKLKIQFQVDYPENLDIDSAKENSIIFDKEYKCVRQTKREWFVPSA